MTVFIKTNWIEITNFSFRCKSLNSVFHQRVGIECRPHFLRSFRHNYHINENYLQTLNLSLYLRKLLGSYKYLNRKFNFANIFRTIACIRVSPIIAVILIKLPDLTVNQHHYHLS